ncbi:hypothetical protein GCM10009841_00690 [Microlunatus panaciterrae]
MLGVVGGVLGVLAAFSIALRLGGERTRDVVKVINKWVLNPAMLTVAGRRHWYASVVHHTGRHSGRPYQTPVVAVPVEDGFVIPLPYGENVDWLKNVLAARRATLVTRGVTHELVWPEVVDASVVLPLLDDEHRRAWRRYGIERFVRLSPRQKVSPFEPGA